MKLPSSGGFDVRIVRNDMIGASTSGHRGCSSAHLWSGRRRGGGPAARRMRHHGFMSNARPPSRSDARMRFEDLSRGPLQTLNRLPKALIVIGLAAFLVGGLLLPSGIGAILLMLLGLFLSWLIALSWPILPPASRAMRVVTVALVFGAAWLRLTGRG